MWILGKKVHTYYNNSTSFANWNSRVSKPRWYSTLKLQGISKCMNISYASKLYYIPYHLLCMGYFFTCHVKNECLKFTVDITFTVFEIIWSQRWHLSKDKLSSYLINSVLHILIAQELWFHVMSATTCNLSFLFLHRYSETTQQYNYNYRQFQLDNYACLL